MGGEEECREELQVRYGWRHYIKRCVRACSLSVCLYACMHELFYIGNNKYRSAAGHSLPDSRPHLYAHINAGVRDVGGRLAGGRGAADTRAGQGPQRRKGRQ